MRKLGITSLYVLAIIQNYPGDAFGGGIEGHLARATQYDEMPPGQTSLILRRLKTRKLLRVRKTPRVPERGKQRIYYALTREGDKTLDEIRRFIQ